MKFKKFEVVESKAGRDQGNIYIISEIIDENYVNLIDGKYRTLSKPKKKKIKHINAVGEIASEIEAIFNDKSKINDAVIKKFLKKFEKSC